MRLVENFVNFQNKWFTPAFENFLRKIAAFEANKPVRIVCSGRCFIFPDQRFAPPPEILQRRHGAGNDYIKLPVLYFFRAGMLRSKIVQPNRCRDLFYYREFFIDAIHKVKLRFREKDCQRQTRETAAGTKVHDLQAFFEIEFGGNRQRMKHMMCVKVIHILPADHIYLFVPFRIKGFQSSELLLLDGGEVAEVLL